jgi:hypothetical protein
MNDGPISTNPNAVGEVTSGLASFGKKLMGAVTGQKKSRTDEMSDSAALHKTVLEVQAAEHSHISSEAEKSRQHQKDLVTHVVTAMEGRGGTLKSDGSKIEYSSPAKSRVASPATKTRKPKSPVPTPPLSKSSKTAAKLPTKSAVPAESVKARKGK